MGVAKTDEFNNFNSITEKAQEIINSRRTANRKIFAMVLRGKHS